MACYGKRRWKRALEKKRKGDKQEEKRREGVRMERERGRERGAEVHKKSVKTRNAGEDKEEREPCYTDGRDVNCQWRVWRRVWCFLKHLKNRARKNRALPLMGV